MRITTDARFFGSKVIRSYSSSPRGSTALGEVVGQLSIDKSEANRGPHRREAACPVRP
jgi:hypothetical protein